MKKADIGIVGLAVMGENLAMNIESKGFCVAVYNREAGVVSSFLQSRGREKNFIGAKSLKELADSLQRPRKIMLMIRAGEPVDEVIDKLLPILDNGDIIIDGGNSHYLDTERRRKYTEKNGIFYIGMGVSGGESGALNGPSLMPGGSFEAWGEVKNIFTAICAKTEKGEPCCSWVGEGGAGHFIKTVHNGIEYGDMQLISESYHLLKNLLGFGSEDIGRIFREWNEGELKSYLIEITGKIFSIKDEDGTALVDKILDSAGQKGTGKWAGIAALEEGEPLTLICSAVFARLMSAMKEERLNASKELTGPSADFSGDKSEYTEHIKRALYASKIISYAQGFSLMKKASESRGWSIDPGAVALIWREGCIIRSSFLEKISEAYNKNKALPNLILDCYFKNAFYECIDSLRKICAVAMLNGISIPAMAAALSYFDAYRSEWLPANLLQAQRDFFGAHTYERTDFPRGKYFHTNWSGEGGATASTAYNA